MSTDRDKALEMALSQIDKQFGKGSIMRMGEKGSMAIEAVSTGALALDLALGIGGLPRGRVTEIYGPESSGKSTLAMHEAIKRRRLEAVALAARLIARRHEWRRVRGRDEEQQNDCDAIAQSH